MALIADVKAAAPSFGCDPDLGQTGIGYAREVPPTFDGERGGGWKARAGWWVRKSEAFAALNVIGGGTPETAVIFGRSLMRIVPLRHPDSLNLVARHVHAEYRGVDPNTPTDYLDCLITVDFDQPDYDLSGDRPFVELTTEPMAGAQTRPAAFYQSGHLPWDQGADPSHSMNLRMTMHQMPVFTPSTWWANANSTNSATWEGFAADTLLFIPPSAGVKRQLGGVTSWQAALNFMVAAPGRKWGYVYLPDGTYVQELDSAGNPVVPRIDFNGLFAE